MIDTWILVIGVIAFAAMSGIALRCLWKVGDMEGKLWTLKDRCSRLEDREIQYVGMINKTNAEVENVKGTIEALSLVHGKQLSDFERRLRGATEGPGAVLIKAINRLVEVVDNLCDRESEDWVGSENRAVSERSKGISEAHIVDGADEGHNIGDLAAKILGGEANLADITESGEATSESLCGGDTDGDSVDLLKDTISDGAVKRSVLENFMESDKPAPHLRPVVESSNSEESEDESAIQPVTYRWIFPDVEAEKGLVFGQWYLVVGEVKGRLKADGSPEIVTDEAMWNGYCFVGKRDSDVRYEHVYAYIKPASAADIMPQVVQLALRRAG